MILMSYTCLFCKSLRLNSLCLILLSLVISYPIVKSNVISSELEEKYDLYSMKATDSNDYCLGLLQELDTLLPTYFPSNPMTIINFPPKRIHLPWLKFWRKWILFLGRVQQFQEQFNLNPFDLKDVFRIIEHFNDLMILTKVTSLQKELIETQQHTKVCIEHDSNECPLYIRNLKSLVFGFNETCPDLFGFQRFILQSFQEKHTFSFIKLQPVAVNFYIYQTILEQIQEFYELQVKERQRFLNQNWFRFESLRLNSLTGLLRDIQENFQNLNDFSSKQTFTQDVQVNEFLTHCTNLLKTKLKHSLIQGYKQVNDFQWIVFEGQGFMARYCFEQCVPLDCDKKKKERKPCNLERYRFLFSSPFYIPS